MIKVLIKFDRFLQRYTILNLYYARSLNFFDFLFIREQIIQPILLREYYIDKLEVSNCYNNEDLWKKLVNIFLKNINNSKVQVEIKENNIEDLVYLFQY